MTAAPRGFTHLALLLGLSSFFMLPVIGDVKPFDLLCLVFVALKLPTGFAFRRPDILFLAFIAFAVASLASARFVVDASALQTVRYLIFFLVARLRLTDAERNAITKGFVWSISANLVWIVADLLQYYTVGDCVSLNEQVFPWVAQVTTHRYPIEVAGCAVLRPTGFTWDPGGLFPLMLVTAFAIGASRLVMLGSFFSLVAVSRTALVTVLTIWVTRRSVLLGWALVASALVVVPAIALVNAHALLVDFDEGTLRHLSYPALAVLGVFENPRYLLLGDGLRGSATMFLSSRETFLSEFFTFDELLAGEAKNFVVESIWVNQLSGVGALGFLAYFSWLCEGLRRHPATLLGLLAAGTYYTFDSSVFCFIAPYLMTVPARRRARLEANKGAESSKPVVARVGSADLGTAM